MCYLACCTRGCDSALLCVLYKGVWQCVILRVVRGGEIVCYDACCTRGYDLSLIHI